MKSVVSEKWFPPSQLAFYFDSNSWAKGTSLYLQNEVVSAKMTSEAEGWSLQAQVQEGREPTPFQVKAHVRVSDGGNLQAWRSTCTCAVGRMCRHGAALGIHAAMQGFHMLEQPSDEALSDENAEFQHQQRLENALQQSEQQVQEWLDRLETANMSHGFSLPSGTAEHFLYILSAATLGHRPVFHLTINRASLKRDGLWSKPKKVSSEPLPHDPVWRTSAPMERGIFDLFKACPATNSFSSYGFHSAVKLQGLAAQLLLKMCSQTGRLMWDGERHLQVLHWTDVSLPVVGQWQATAAQDPQPSGWQLQLRAEKDGVVHAFNEPPMYVDPELGVCGLLDTQGMSADQLVLLSQSPVVPERVAVKLQQQLITRLGSLPLPPVIEQMPEIRGVLPQGVLTLTALPAARRSEKGLFEAQLAFNYDGVEGRWPTQPTRVVVRVAGQSQILVRHLAAEQAIWDQLNALGLERQQDDVLTMSGPQAEDLWLQWLESDFAVLRQAGLQVHQRDGMSHWLRQAQDVKVSLTDPNELDDTSPWFDLSLGMDLDGKRVNILPWVPAIVAALARTAAVAAEASDGADAPELAPYLYLPDLQGPGYVKLPTAKIRPWLATLMELHGERGRDWDGDVLRLSRMDALRCAASLGEGAVWQGAQRLQHMMLQMRGQNTLPDVPCPEGLQATLRPYQQQGLNWLQFLREHRLAGILADDMGLGKTLQTLAHILTEKQAGRLTEPALIVAPVSLLGNWQREAARFCPSLTTHVHHGLTRHGEVADLRAYDVVITAYSLLSRDRELWVSMAWHVLVLDEAQNIKNANSYAAQTVSEIPAQHRLCLSGTPIENHLGELWSQFHFLMPGFLGSQKRFTELFRNPIERHGDAGRMTQLRDRITPFMLRRTKDLVASELPPKIETLMPVLLSGPQADLYETIRLGMEKTVREALSTQGLGKSQITILDALLKLRQVCCDPRLLKMNTGLQVKTSAKLAQLLDMLPEMVAEGRKILLFSQFTEMLALIEEALPALNIPWVKLTGQSKNRDAIIDQFTTGQVPLFLISLKAGGVGLNLPQADTVIHYDPWWNPAVENQATDRAHRLGQTQSVWVVKLVAQGTIEERMLALQERKAQLAKDMYEGAVQRKEPLFGEADLNELFKPLGD
ncbi:DEAD/DEAH box helicase [Limnohabitans sp. WS1]|uniref:DEAD/DEAH box helicase n=1 Tax=Limnohabitans sp. WS1 TaxID=1100726 RepID=UPI000D3B0FBD|nr:DEAD/DEAH box helicase [Limnohabitans sp. WS1]PUE07516.1 helicase SNF2 [Limnohabitans sp. WS1]